MLKILSKLLLPSARMLRRSPFIKIPLYPNVIARWHSNTTPRPSKEQIAINEQLLKSKTTQEVMSIYQTSKSAMNLINLSVLMKQLNDFQKGRQEPLSIGFSNEILSSVLSGIEKEDMKDARLCSSLYYNINRFPGIKLRERCNAILEHKGMQIYKQMNNLELTNFVYTLAQNNKRDNIRMMLPYIESNLASYTLRGLTSILYAVALVDINDEVFSAKVQDFLINTKLKANAHDYSLILFYCGKNPNVMVKPELFKKLEETAKYQVPYCNEIGLSNIFHSLTFYETPMVSAEFYQLFEARILEFLPQMNNRSLSLILRGYSIFGFGSETFYTKMREEAQKRINSFDTEAFSTVFYHLAAKKQITDDFLEECTQRLDQKNILMFSTKQFQHILYAFSTLARENLYKPNRDLVQSLVLYIENNIDSFTFQELGNVASMSSIASIRSQKEIARRIRDRIMKTNEESVDLRALSDIVFFIVHEFQDLVEHDCALRLIDITLDASKNVETLREYAKMNNLRYYGKLVVALSELKGLNKEYENKRKQIIQTFEAWLIENCGNNLVPPQDFSLEGTLMHFITSFYSVLGSPSGEMKALFRNALRLLNDIKQPENLEFLSKQTDLIN